MGYNQLHSLTPKPLMLMYKAEIVYNVSPFFKFPAENFEE